MTFVKGHLSKTKSQVSDIRAIGLLVYMYSILEMKQCPRCQVFLKSIHAVTSSDCLVNAHLYLKVLCPTHIYAYQEHTFEIG